MPNRLAKTNDRTSGGYERPKLKAMEMDAQRIDQLFDTMDEALGGLTDRDARLLAFVNALQHGMPEEEAAKSFLGKEPEEYYEALENSEKLNLIVTRIVANIAQDQYSKIINATGKGSVPAAIEWLKANRPDVWGPKSKVDVTSGGEPVKSGLTLEEAEAIVKARTQE